MRRALLVVGVGMGLALVLVPPARAQQRDPDPWFGPDKVLHFEASASIAVVVYAGASFATEDRAKRAAAAAGVALAAGLLKEGWDLTGHGDASWRDLTWDVIGTTTGVLIAYGIDWAIGRLRGRPPAPAATDR